MDYVKALREVLRQARYRTLFIILLVVLALIFAVTSDIIVLSTLELNPIADPTKIALMFMIVILMALNGTVLFHNYEARKSLGKKTTALGTVAALFTTTCPVCQPIWLVWLGFGSVSAFLADVSIYVALLSLSLLFVSLHYSLRSISNVCEVNSNGKKPEDNRHALQIMRDAAD